MTQQVVGKDAGNHRLANGNGADSYAGIVPPMSRDLDLVAGNIDSAQ